MWRDMDAVDHIDADVDRLAPCYRDTLDRDPPTDGIVRHGQGGD